MRRLSVGALMALGIVGAALAMLPRGRQQVAARAPRRPAATFAAPASVDTIDTRAAVALGQLSDPQAAPELARLAAGRGPAIVRANAARALGLAGGREQQGTLVTLVRDGAAPLRVRQEAALALARAGDAAAAPALAETLDDLAADVSPAAEQLRISLVQALASIGGPTARAAMDRHAARRLSPLERAFIVVR